MESQLPDYGKILDGQMTHLVETSQRAATAETAELKRVALKQIDAAMQALCEQLRLRMTNHLTLASLNAEPLNVDFMVKQQQEINREMEERIATKQLQDTRKVIILDPVPSSSSAAEAAPSQPPAAAAAAAVVGAAAESAPAPETKPEKDMVAAIRVLEEERELLKKQVANLKMQTRNSKHYVAVQSEYDETFLKEHVDQLKAQMEKQMESSTTALAQEVARLRKEAADARAMCTAQTELAGKLTRATKDLTASHRLISAELEGLRKENERLEEQLMSAAQQVRDMSTAKSGAAVLKARLVEAEERRRREVAQLLRENDMLKQLIEDERQKSLAGEAMQEMLDSVLANLETERKDLRRRLALEHTAYGGANASM